MKPDISFRQATLNDLALLQHWDKQQHVIDSDPDEDWDWPSMLTQTHDWQELIIAQLEGRPIGFVQIIDPALEETHYWGDVPENLRGIDIWIGEAEDLGKGYGTEMMRLAFEKCFATPEVKCIIIDPLATNIRAHKFYERLGFEFVERKKFGDEDCFVYQLPREKWALRYL